MMPAAGADILADDPCLKIRITPAVMVIGRPGQDAEHRLCHCITSIIPKMSDQMSMLIGGVLVEADSSFAVVK